uniref:Uncharacterized protein n=1 Tax=Chromera velia CCMP2878 TaxID=1169474 RepID=A0A0G4ID63_9ALVE|eukprot:Cvel_13286.t1-p1 / transcript=Cvel_13286.t1 / gene=Cvel_13286 / organism=Chromera_velia_CCMP2878 / gene_product=hypothetical protein / transcript_product=hypothetical protein / location=Cvel_scaffold901:42596-44259(+) / protein_length=340 / sequence_SO=supercontig / SO=protein_coding / is_pseudo=false
MEPSQEPLPLVHHVSKSSLAASIQQAEERTSRIEEIDGQGQTRQSHGSLCRAGSGFMPEYVMDPDGSIPLHQIPVDRLGAVDPRSPDGDEYRYLLCQSIARRSPQTMIDFCLGETGGDHDTPLPPPQRQELLSRAVSQMLLVFLEKGLILPDEFLAFWDRQKQWRAEEAERAANEPASLRVDPDRVEVYASCNPCLQLRYGLNAPSRSYGKSAPSSAPSSLKGYSKTLPGRGGTSMRFRTPGPVGLEGNETVSHEEATPVHFSSGKSGHRGRTLHPRVPPGRPVALPQQPSPEMRRCASASRGRAQAGNSGDASFSVSQTLPKRTGFKSCTPSTQRQRGF